MTDFPYTSRQQRWWFAQLEEQENKIRRFEEQYRRTKSVHTLTAVGSENERLRQMRISARADKGIAFHASANEFEAFDVARAGSSTDDGFLGRGLYFSTDHNVARKGETLYEVDLQIRNPLILQSRSWSTGEKKRLVREALGLPLSASADDVTRAALAAGFDGVVLDNAPIGYMQKEIVVFRNDQVSIRKRSTVQ